MIFHATFANTTAVLPVIHVSTSTQALRQASVAIAAGSDGVFLIDHDGDSANLDRAYAAVTREFPALWVGVNHLGLTAGDAFERAGASTAGVWSDYAAVDDGDERQPVAAHYAAQRAAAGFTGLYFGGVDFKYQRRPADRAAAARRATEFVEVITTSGPATGVAAQLGHLVQMREAIGDHPLAVASGITPDNVTTYLDVIDAVLVSTGVSSDFHTFDPDRLRRLVDTVRDH